MSKTVFSQIMEHIPKYEFDKRVSKYNGNYKVRTFTCWDQFLCMSFAQLTYRESLRDIEACLTAQPNKLYHMGIKGTVAKSNLARANEKESGVFMQTLHNVLFPKQESFIMMILIS